MTQIPLQNLSFLHIDQRHQLICSPLGHFTGPQLRWPTLEKEAFSVMETAERMHWLLATTNGFDLHADYHKLIFLLSILTVDPDRSKPSLYKVIRWVVRLSAYNYICVHIKGVDNVWADLLGLWSAPEVVRRFVKISVLLSTSSKCSEWPSPFKIKSAQESNLVVRPSNLALKDDL